MDGKPYGPLRFEFLVGNLHHAVDLEYRLNPTMYIFDDTVAPVGLSGPRVTEHQLWKMLDCLEDEQSSFQGSLQKKKGCSHGVLSIDLE